MYNGYLQLKKKYGVILILEHRRSSLACAIYYLLKVFFKFVLVCNIFFH